MDTIANFLTTLLNAQRVGRPFVEVPASRAIFELAQILAKNGFLKGVEKKTAADLPKLRLTLRYAGALPVVQGVRRLSRPGRRLYAKRTEVRKGAAAGVTVIVSTPQGLMTGPEALKAGLGGELICQIW